MVFSVEFILKMGLKWVQNFKLIHIAKDIKWRDLYKHLKIIVLLLFGKVKDKMELDSEYMVKYL